MALEGPCGRYAWIALEGLRLRMDSDGSCSSCGWSQTLTPTESGYEYQLARGTTGELTTHSWICTADEVALRQVVFGAEEDLDLDFYDPPVVRWVDGLVEGDSWTTTTEVVRVRGGEIKDVATRTSTMEVEEEELLDLPPGRFETVKLRELETGERRWVAEGFGVVQIVDDAGTAQLIDVVWPSGDTGQ